MATPGKPTILVTGGAGYIVSHTALLLEQPGYYVIVLDDMVYGHWYIIALLLQAKVMEIALSSTTSLQPSLLTQ